MPKCTYNTIYELSSMFDDWLKRVTRRGPTFFIIYIIETYILSFPYINDRRRLWGIPRIHNIDIIRYYKYISIIFLNLEDRNICRNTHFHIRRYFLGEGVKGSQPPLSVCATCSNCVAVRKFAYYNFVENNLTILYGIRVTLYILYYL
jgi:hypothetical protein